MKFLLTQAHIGLEISQCFSYSFHPISAKIHCIAKVHQFFQPHHFITNFYAVIQAIIFLGYLTNFKTLWNFNMGNQWGISNAKICIVLKKADRRAKRMNLLPPDVNLQLFDVVAQYIVKNPQRFDISTRVLFIPSTTLLASPLANYHNVLCVIRREH